MVGGMGGLRDSIPKIGYVVYSILQSVHHILTQLTQLTQKNDH